MDLEEFRRERDERLRRVAQDNGYPLPTPRKSAALSPTASFHAICIHCGQPFGINGGVETNEVAVCDICLGD